MNCRLAGLTLLIIATTSTHAADPQGHTVYEKWCAPCHAPGPGHPGTAALAVLYRNAKPAALEQREDLTAPFIAAVVRQGVYSMPFFRKTEIDDEELAALTAYLTRSTNAR